MKMNLLKIGFFAIIFSMTLLVSSCSQHNHDSEEQHEESSIDAKTGKEYTSAFVCPMHCEGSGSDAEGQCPACKMAYVPNENHSEDKHEH